MNQKHIALLLSGALTVSLLAGCAAPAGGESTPPQTSAPAQSTPLPSQTAPASEPPLPSETPAGAETPAPSETPGTGTEPAPTPKPTATAKPTQKPTATPKPTAAPTATPKPSDTPSAVSVSDIWAAMGSDYSGMADIDAALLSDLYGISDGDLEEFVGKMPLINVKATEFFIARVKDGKMDAVKSGIANRQAALEQQWSQYLPDQYEIVKNYKMVTNGNYVLFCIAEDADAAVTVFNSYTK